MYVHVYMHMSSLAVLLMKMGLQCMYACTYCNTQCIIMYMLELAKEQVCMCVSCIGPKVQSSLYFNIIVAVPIYYICTCIYMYMYIPYNTLEHWHHN